MRRERGDDQYYFQLDSYSPLWFQCEGEPGEDAGDTARHWTFGDEYWQVREKGFQGVQFEPIW